MEDPDSVTRKEERNQVISPANEKRWGKRSVNFVRYLRGGRGGVRLELVQKQISGGKRQLAARAFPLNPPGCLHWWSPFLDHSNQREANATGTVATTTSAPAIHSNFNFIHHGHLEPAALRRQPAQSHRQPRKGDKMASPADAVAPVSVNGIGIGNGNGLADADADASPISPSPSQSQSQSQPQPQPHLQTDPSSIPELTAKRKRETSDVALDDTSVKPIINGDQPLRDEKTLIRHYFDALQR